MHIEKFKLKIIKYLQKNPSIDFKKKEYLDNQTFNILGEVYVLKLNVVKNKSAKGKLVFNNLMLELPFDLSSSKKTKVISILVNKLLSHKYLTFIKKRVDYYNNLYFKKELGKISLKKATSKLGSCTIDSNLMFSTTILLFPEDIRDYIIVHELAHTIEHNHSKRFWAIVERIIPDYKDKKKWTKNNTINLEI